MARLNDGFKTLITFDLAASVKFWEKTIKPPGLSAGGANDTTTMRNTRWRTRQPKQLVTATDITATCAYDPECYNSVVTSLIGKNGLITITMPDLSTVAVWGWVDSFEPAEHTEGAQPTATITIILSNENATGVETAPLYTAAPASGLRGLPKSIRDHMREVVEANKTGTKKAAPKKRKGAAAGRKTTLAV